MMVVRHAFFISTSSLMQKVRLLVVTWMYLFTISDAVNTLTSSPPDATGGELTVCPGEMVTFMCSHIVTDGQVTRVDIPSVATCSIVHDGQTPTPQCLPFTITMISNDSGATLDSTAELPVTENLDGATVNCRSGPVGSSPLVGSITLRVIGSPSVPTIGPIQYSVESATTGSVMFTVSSMGSFGTGLTYSGSASSGLVQTDGDVVTVTGLSYTGQHILSVIAASAVCPNTQPTNTTVPIIFSTEAPLLNQPIASVTCLDPSLPIKLSWTVDTGTQHTTDPFVVALNPPLIEVPVITYNSSRGQTGMTSSNSSYSLSNTSVGITFTFNVSVHNAGGIHSALSNQILIDTLEIDASSVETSNCLTIKLNQDCSEDPADFIIQLQFAFDTCKRVCPQHFTTSVIPVTSHSMCIDLGGGSGSGGFCYHTVLMYQNSLIETEPNVNFTLCSIASLESFLGSNISYQLDGANCGGAVPVFTTATLSCTETFSTLIGSSQTTCIDGKWSETGMRSCIRSYTEPITITVVVTFLLTLVLGVSIGALSVWGYYKCRRSDCETLQPPTEMGTPPVIYEEPEDIKPDPHTEGNLAYGHVQPLSSRR